MPADSPHPRSPLAAVQELRASFGIDARRVDSIGRLLTDGQFRSVAQIVSLTGTSRRTVEAVLQALDRHLDSSGGRVRIAAEHARAYARQFGFGEVMPAGDPWYEMAGLTPQGVAQAAGLIERAPPPRQDLDQLPATATTVLKRGRYLLDRFDLRGARVLCVGDHDLTSLGLFLAGGAAGLRVSVVDADEPLLEYLDTEARRRGFDVRCYFADLRLGLPASLRDSSQLVFTDPPYAPEGVRLFVTRGLQGLGDHRNGRVAVAYGFGEQQPALGLAVQQALSPLHLVHEAVLPGFNRYAGGQAVGSAAALYLLRTTRRTRSAARASYGDPRPQLYTRGAQSVESPAAWLDDAAAARVAALAAGQEESRLLVGPAWPASVPGRRLPLTPSWPRPCPAPRTTVPWSSTHVISCRC